jgi:putative spermidine/putrescine transport system permease protein
LNLSFLRHWPRWSGALFIILVLAFLTVPSLLIVISSFNSTAILDFPPHSFSLKWYRIIAERPDFRQGFINTAIIGASSTFFSLVVGIGAALIVFRGSLPGRQVINGLLLSPLVLPGVLIGVGLLMVAAKTGGVGGFSIVIVAHVLMVIPFVLRSLLISLENIDENLEKAAMIFGANPLKRFFYVTLPMLKPGIVAAILFSLVTSVNEFAVSVFVTSRSTQTMPVVIFNYTMAYVDPTIAAVSTLYIVATVLSVWLMNRFGGLEQILKLERKS